MHSFCLILSVLLTLGSPDGFRRDTLDTLDVSQDSLKLPSVDTVAALPEKHEYSMFAEPDTLEERSIEIYLNEERKHSHMKFKGIPIDGSPSAFAARMTEAGFKCINISTFTGKFAGVEGATIKPSVGEGLVYKVVVTFPSQQHWFEAKQRYMTFKSWFEWKYVWKPAYVRHKLSKAFPEGSGQEAWGFENGSSQYETVFEFVDGTARLYIEYEKRRGGLCVCVDYIDRINSIFVEEADMSDL